MKRVNGMLDMRIVQPHEAKQESDSPQGKAYLELKGMDTDGNPVTMNVTLNIGGMVGGAAKGTAERFGYPW
jgi:hypothetical protein